MNERIGVSICQQRLAIIWFAGTGLVLALLLAQTMLGKYGDQVEKAWSWFLPTVAPTLSLILGAIAYQARQGETTATVDRFFFRLSAALSIIYLLLVLASLLMQPLSDMTPLRLLDVSNLWLGPAQGLVGIALGAFFGSRQT